MNGAGGESGDVLDLFYKHRVRGAFAVFSKRMKTNTSLLLIAGTCLLTFLNPVADAKPAKNAASKATPGCSRFDADENGALDDKEKTALREAFEAGDTTLRLLDTNNNGKLDESEIEAIKLDDKKKGKGKKKKNT